MDDLKTIFFDRGLATGLGVQEIIDNFDVLKDAIEEKDPEFDYLQGLTGFGSYSAAFDERGLHTLFDARTHPNLKITHAYVTLGDSAKQELTVRLLKNDRKDIAEPVTLKSTESRGKVQIFDLVPHSIVGRFDSLGVDLSADRRVAVDVSFINLRSA